MLFSCRLKVAPARSAELMSQLLLHDCRLCADDWPYPECVAIVAPTVCVVSTGEPIATSTTLRLSVAPRLRHSSSSASHASAVDCVLMPPTGPPFAVACENSVVACV